MWPLFTSSMTGAGQRAYRGHPTGVPAPAAQSDRQQGDDSDVGEEAGDLPGLVAGADSGQPVDGAEPGFGHRGVDRGGRRPVDAGAVQRPVGQRTGPLRRPQPRLPEAGEMRRTRRVAVGVDAGRLHPPVPRVAEEIVRRRGWSGQRRQPQRHRHQEDRALRPPAGGGGRPPPPPPARPPPRPAISASSHQRLGQQGSASGDTGREQ